MKLRRFFHLRWLFSKQFIKQVAWGLLWFIIVILVALGVCMAGIEIAGDVQNWDDWLTQYAPAFLLWRVFLYTALIYGWCWMRKRVIVREVAREVAQEVKASSDDGADNDIGVDASAHEKRLKRKFLVSEVCAVIALLTMEVSNWLA